MAIHFVNRAGQIFGEERIDEALAPHYTRFTVYGSLH